MSVVLAVVGSVSSSLLHLECITSVQLLTADVLRYRHGAYELLHCLGTNIPAINAVECVFASQLPSVAAVPALSSAYNGQHEITD